MSINKEFEDWKEWVAENPVRNYLITAAVIWTLVGIGWALAVFL